MRQHRLPIAVVALLLPAAALAADTLIAVSAPQLKSLAIAVQPLASLKASAARRLPAQVVVPPRQVELMAAPLAGLVTAVTVAGGETVQKGQSLARLQGPQLLELQRDYLHARSQQQLAAETRRRDEALHADGIIAQARLSASQAAERQAAALLAEKRQALQLAGLAAPDGKARGLSGRAAIRAPFAGVVLEANVAAGQRVDAAAPLFKLARIDGASPLWLEIQASAAEAAGLAPGDSVAVPGCAAPARLTLIAPHLNAASQAILLRAELPRPAGCVRPYQFVQAEVTPARAGGDAWRVPAGAVTRHQGQAWLFVEAAGGFRPAPVRVLDETEQSTLVGGELKGEARIAIRGVAALKAAWLGLGAADTK